MSARTAQRTEAILRDITSAENVLREQRPADFLVQYAGETAEYVHGNTVGSADLTYQADTAVQGSVRCPNPRIMSWCLMRPAS
jgi:hypothetical protein